MTGYLLDTNICVFFIRGKYALNEKINEVGFDNCYISEITLAELKYGAECSNKAFENRSLITDFAQEINILPLYDCFDVYAQEKARLRRIGHIIDDFDLLIAATAIYNKLTLVTDNSKHFDRISGILLDNWVIR
ncbi:MAG: type II toxin-antitoxin system VapC family toxin [Prevotellaceae bacterium]|jgi:tRNA(fMet)-specific endonuclease VapC|nr:type II toxin-antitoxin system VapC family toxin [Prevotellaceae bacterium]